MVVSQRSKNDRQLTRGAWASTVCRLAIGSGPRTAPHRTATRKRTDPHRTAPPPASAARPDRTDRPRRTHKSRPSAPTFQKKLPIAIKLER
jgi:hypothetical protein